MSLSLVSHPVQTVGGQVRNILPGLSPIEVEWKREDVAITSVGDDSGNAAILISGDYRSLVDVGQDLYVYSVGTNHTYDVTAEVLSVAYSAPNSTIVLDTPYVEAGTGGYMNYFLNYYVETKLLNATTDADLLGFSIITDGKNNGEIVVNLSIINDENVQDVVTASGENTNARIKFKFEYREVYEGSSNSFSPDPNGEEIICIYAKTQPTIESIESEFDYPRLYEGYPFFVNAYHSDQNETGNFAAFQYEEMDANQGVLGSAIEWQTFDILDYGQLIGIFNTDNFIFTNNPSYIQFSIDYRANFDYDASDYNNTDYTTS